MGWRRRPNSASRSRPHRQFRFYPTLNQQQEKSEGLCPGIRTQRDRTPPSTPPVPRNQDKPGHTEVGRISNKADPAFRQGRKRAPGPGHMNFQLSRTSKRPSSRQETFQGQAVGGRKPLVPALGHDTCARAKQACQASPRALEEEGPESQYRESGSIRMLHLGRQTSKRGTTACLSSQRPLSQARLPPLRGRTTTCLGRAGKNSRDGLPTWWQR